MSSSNQALSEARITAYLRGELTDEARADVERQMDEEPQWLSVLAVLAEDLGGGADLGGVGPRGRSSCSDARVAQLRETHGQRPTALEPAAHAGHEFPAKKPR